MNTNSIDRFGSFFSRIETERSALAIVNERFSYAAELHGLTTEAILQWEKRITEFEVRLDKVDSICFILFRISERCKSEADQSRVVFDGEPLQRLPIVGLLTQLYHACLNFGVKSN